MLPFGIALAGGMATPAYAGDTTEEVETVPETVRSSDPPEHIGVVWTGGTLIVGGVVATLVGDGYYAEFLRELKQHKDPGRYFESETERNADIPRYDRNRKLAYGLTYGGLGAIALGAGVLVLDHELSYRKWTASPSVQLVAGRPSFGIHGSW